MKLVPLLLALLFAAPVIAAPKTVIALDKDWQVRIDPRDDAAAKAHPAAARWLPATVPGSVQQDLIAAGIVPDPFVGLNEAAIQWAGLAGWHYRTAITVTPAMLARDHLDLVFDGLDTFAKVAVNGRSLIDADNAHRRWRADAKPLLHLGANELTIAFASPIAALQPMVLAQKDPLPGEYDSAFGDEPKGRQTSPYIRKPKYQYGWDWAPRIVTIGPWRPARLEGWDDARIETLRIEQEALGARTARLLVRLDLVADRAGPLALRIDLTGPDGKRSAIARTVAATAGASTVTVPLDIADPRRWWPAGYGAQPLYTVAATILRNGRAIDRMERRTGLRTVRLLRQQGSFGFAVNGVPIFAKGANLIPFDSFPARVTPDRMRAVLAAARDANMNMIRVWGGGYYLDDAFYDAADAMGLMIWQDFMFGGAVTPPDAAFRDSVRAEAREQVDRLQTHPSIVLWAGGNEVLSGWQNWSDRKAFKLAVGADERERIGAGMAVLFDSVLREAVATRSPGTPYWPGSPSSDYDGPIDTDANGDRHLWDIWSGSKPIERYTDNCPRFMSEYGMQAMPGPATIARFAGAGDLDPESAVMRAHQKFLNGEGNQRLLFYIRARYREPRDFADFVYLSQVMQADGIALAASHHRACRPVTMGSLYWQLNDVWPGTSWSSIDWFGRWKLLHYAARRFYAPQAIVAEHRDGKTRIALISDAMMPIAARWRVRTMDMAGNVLGEREGAVTLAPLSATDAASLSDADLFGAADPARSYAVAELVVAGHAVSRALVERLAPKAMAYPQPGLSVRWANRTVTITATRLARAVQLGFGTLDAQVSDNGFDLLPGESRTLTVTSSASSAALAAALTLATLGPADAPAASMLTLAEKAAQLQNAAPAQSKLGLPAYDWWNEGLHGLARNGPATVFPQAIGLAASWDEGLMQRVGDAVATEARARFNARPAAADRGLFEGLTIWSPNINIFRDPRWGRGQETYGEDPVLTGRMAVAFIRGLQGPDPAHPKVIATPKHFVVHSGPETGRDSFNLTVSPRDLEKTYLPAFRAAIVEGGARSLMCAYNAIKGTPVCASRALMTDRLRHDWGFTGLTVSDCDAIADIYQYHHAESDAPAAAAAALNAGTDLNCGSTYAALPEAVRRGLTSEGAIDAALARATAARRALGIAAGTSSVWDTIGPDAVGSPANRALALEAAEKAIVLLENRKAVLPLAAGRVRLAVIGANADDLDVLEANYHGVAIDPVTPLEGLRARFGVANVRYAQGSVLAEGTPVVVPETALRSGGLAGLTGEYRDADGHLVATRQDRRIDFDYARAAPLPGLSPQAFSVRWSGDFVTPGPGSYRLVLGGPACWHACPAHDAIRLWIDGQPAIDGSIAEKPLEADIAGGTHAIRIEIDHRGGDEGLRLGWISPAEAQRAEAVMAARDADVVVAVVGLSPDLEGEALKVAVPGFAGGDRTSIALPAPQRLLLDALVATGKSVIIVVTAGSAVALGDLADKARAVLVAWYPGQAGGTALARMLAGDVSPAGRLPVTVYRTTADLPPFTDYTMKERTYRYFTGTAQWRFGHGLSYTSFGYGAPAASAPSLAPGATVTLSATVTNTGTRAGDEVVEAYLVPPADGGQRMPNDPALQRELVGFSRVTLRPGERRTISIPIDARRMSSVDRTGARRVLPGAYRAWIGGGQPGDGPGRWTGFTLTGSALGLLR